MRLRDELRARMESTPLWRAVEIHVARLGVVSDLARDAQLRHRLQEETRCWTQAERRRARARTERMFRRALAIIRRDRRSREAHLFGAVLVDAALGLVEENYVRGEPFLAYAIGMELLDLIAARDAENEARRWAKGVTPHEELVGRNAAAIASVVNWCGLLIAHGDVDAVDAEIDVLVQLSLHLRRYRMKAIERALAARRRHRMARGETPPT